jgi:hypothetical protein
MRRRGFIKTGIATIAAGATSPSVLGEILAPLGENISVGEMENFMIDMDAAMDRISYSGGHYLKNLIPQTPLENDLKFFRSSMRSLLLVGNFGDLSIKGQVHPGMQKRILYSAPEINYTLTNSINTLRNISSESMEEIHSSLLDDEVLGDRILQALDLEARDIGVPSARRRQMKVMGNRIIRRLKHSPEMLIDEYVKKGEKLLAASGSDEAMENLFKSQIGEIEYSNRQRKAESAALQWRTLDLPEDTIGYKPILIEQQDIKPSKGKMDKTTRSGLLVLGLGVIITAVGWIIIAASEAMAGVIMGITVGPLLILIAIIVLIVQGSKKNIA